MVQNGQELEVIVLNFEEETERVSLGYKQLIPDPFEDVGSRYPIGAIVRGTVVHTTDHHAFIKLEEGIEGIVHVSEMSWNPRIKSASKFVEKESVIEAKVQAINYDERRLSLSMRELEDDPWEDIAHRYPVNSIVKGVVRNITDFGIFVGIEECIDGLIHVSDLSWSHRQKNPSEIYTRGQEIEARVFEIDVEKRRFSLSVKALADDPWLSVNGRYFLGQIVKGAVVAHTDFGIFVEVEDGVEGLVHSTELTAETNWEEAYPMGEEISVEIRSIDSHKKKISLSERGANERAGAEGRTVDEFIATQSESSASLGDVLADLSERIGEE
jgi:small subunit ribosomal protein S1